MSVQVTYSDEEYEVLQAILRLADSASKQYGRSAGLQVPEMERLGAELGKLEVLGGLPS